MVLLVPGGRRAPGGGLLPGEIAADAAWRRLAVPGGGDGSSSGSDCLVIVKLVDENNLAGAASAAVAGAWQPADLLPAMGGGIVKVV